jgi:hypothetical protein
MKIIHASMPADDPRHVAEVLSEIMGGEALPFPPGGPGSWMAWAADGILEIEIVPRGHVMHQGEKEAEWRQEGEPRRLSEVHFAIGVNRPAAEIVAIAQRAAWPARTCTRGDMFDLIEVWVENAFLLELFDPEQKRVYEELVTLASWKELLAAGAPDPSGRPGLG